MSVALQRVTLDLETRLCSAPACPRDAEPGTARCRQHPHADAARLALLATEAAAAHKAAGLALNETIQHAIVCGEKLLAAHTIIKASPDVAWGEWLAENLAISNRYAYGYMRLAVHRDAIPAEAFAPYVDARGRLREPSVSRAIEMAAHLPAIADKNHHCRIGDEIRAEIVRLRGEGFSYAEISRRVGVHHVTVARILDPELDRTKRAASNRQKRAQTATERAAADAALQQRIAAALAARPELAEPYRLAAALVDALAGDETVKNAHRYAKAARNALTEALVAP